MRLALARPHRTGVAALLAILALSALLGGRQPAAAQGQHTVYLPLLASPGTAQPPPPPAQGSLVFTGSAARSADIAVDAQGGIHAIAVRDNPRLGGDVQAVIYAYCAPASLARCNARAGWGFVELAADAVFAQLELDRQGRPRILYDEGDSNTFVYAACDGACTRAASWKRLPVTSRSAIGSPFVFDYKQQFFALDQLGRPRFIYEDYHPTGTQEHEGVFYAFCDANCTVPGSWRETRIMLKPDFSEQISLAFDSKGRLRGLTTMYWQGDDGAQNGRLTYLSCEGGCERADSWRLTPLPLDRGYEHSQFTIKVDSKDRLRVLFYRGYTQAEPRGKAHLFYLWCDAACASTESWDGTYLPAFDGDYAYDGDLAFDAADNPRIAVYKPTSLHYAWCDRGCQSGEGVWANKAFDLGPIMEAQMPLSTWPGCIRGTWVAGQRPALALDPHGNPRLAFDADHYMECYKNPGRPQDGTYTESKWQSAGVYFFARP